MLAKGLKLVVPSSVKGCRKAGARRLSQKAENDYETSSTEEGHDDKHKSEMKAKKTNLKNISALLKASFSHRRKWINGLTGKGAVKKVLEEYPGFNKYNQVSTKFFFTLYLLTM